MIVGSLIKNPGGGLAPIGGYIAGKKECVENAAYRLTSPGLGKEVGASLGILKDFYQGFFLAPTVTAGALKGAIFAANVYEKLGFAVVPNGSESRHDIIQAVTFGQPEGVIGFCQGIQAAAPVDSHVTPEPGICRDMMHRSLWQREHLFPVPPLSCLRTAPSSLRMQCISRADLPGSMQSLEY